MNSLGRISTLFRELAEAFDALEAEQRTKPPTKTRRKDLTQESTQAVAMVRDSLRRGGIKVA